MYYSDLSDLRIWCLRTNPKNLHTVEECRKYDAYAVRDIERLREAITEMEAYRKLIAERAAAIMAVPGVPKLTIARQKSYYDKRVTYRVVLWECYDNKDIKDRVIEEHLFNGRERKQALEKFEALKKTHPGITAERHLDKERWER